MKRYANLQALCERDLEQEWANSQCVPHPSAVYTSSFVNKTWFTNCTVYTRAHEPTARVPKKVLVKISFECDIHCYPNFISFARPASLYCEEYVHTWCGRKVMRLATLCTIQQRCCLPLHMAVRLTSAVDSVQVWTCYSCYAIVDSFWSEVVFVRCVTKMDRQRFEQRCAIKFCVKLGESATVTYEKLQRAYGEHSLSRAQVFRRHKSSLEGREQVEDEPRAGRHSTSKTEDNVEIVRSLWGQIVDWRWEWSVVS